MIQLKEIRISAMPNEMHTQFHEDIEIIINKRPPSVFKQLGFEDAMPLFVQAVENQKAVLDIVTASKYSLLMLNKDHSRDHAVKGFAGYVKNMRHHHDVAVQEAAARVYTICKHYGNITKKSFDEETAAISDMLREYERDDLAADILTVKATEWIERIIEENNEFIALAHQRYAENAEMPTVRMKDVRKNTDRLYRSITGRLQYMITVGKTSIELAELVAEINAVVKHYKNQLAIKAGRGVVND